MTSSIEMRHYPVVEAVIGIFADWLHHRREISEVCDCDDEEFRRIAHDLGVSTNDLDGLVRAGPHAADELPKMMAALNLNPDDIRRVQPLVMRDLERVCSVCSHKNRCDSELVAGTAAERHAEFCNNADTLDTLIKEGAQKH